MSDRDRDFAEYFGARSTSMRGTAYLLCGDWHRAEDLVQTAFVKLYRVWDRVAERGKLDGYTRQILVRTFLDETRRGFFKRETVTEDPGDHASPSGGSVEDRVVLLRALARVPARQRAALVLRYWEDLSLEETARVMGCSEGTVKSQAARGLVNLRGLLPAPTATL
ncbi:SigE family RNA polymerase sigma factor [Actinokineospora globicatena]|uniref:RNA polymerase sigma24 factor n=1 Tax=Actinokineospora globicatena TaxID=103729 RepID=A0A9W6V8L9_9PSEU|nr:SigE family RNA polymerase sigma factor [Actinokineospora globicatena]MCP2301603.1 RNA polymerase sigma-70 factor, sigma-E family [Actinokineospora globicatena]GLW76743.1 RNA polymerase sigma24 factor [Actinokineospora globicatena]GLW83576.1 RNA polymerase sigma24 factor [Actinokineospora globicatena]GLW92477.1 RNA polymerase sigma24 factor [Actinokineospora globicatena]